MEELASEDIEFVPRRRHALLPARQRLLLLFLFVLRRGGAAEETGARAHLRALPGQNKKACHLRCPQLEYRAVRCLPKTRQQYPALRSLEVRCIRYSDTGKHSCDSEGYTNIWGKEVTHVCLFSSFSSRSRNCPRTSQETLNPIKFLSDTRDSFFHREFCILRVGGVAYSLYIFLIKPSGTQSGREKKFR